MFAITGASGQLGRLAVTALQRRVGADRVVALARTPDRAADLGVAVRRFDYDDAASLPAALEGVERLLLVSSSEIGRRVEQHRNVIEAARRAGVGFIAYTSLLHADSSTLDLAEEHRQTEALLADSGIAHAVLRNGWYWENHTQSLPGALAAGAMTGCAGDGRISWAARQDYAEAAAAVLATRDAPRGVFELAGDQAHTLAELAAELSRQSGQPIVYQNLPAQAYADLLASFGLPAALATAIAGWDAAAASGALQGHSPTLSRLIGRPTTSMADAVAAALATTD